jgi:hypothetical protein
MVEVIVTVAFKVWYEDLAQSVQESVYSAVTQLEEKGVSLGFARCSDILGSRYPLRELRIQSGGRPIRVFYAFDPKRQAVLLLGADKTGRKRFYKEMIARAEALWQEYLQEKA